VAQALQQAGITPELKQITLIPETTVDLDAETGRKVLKLLEALDDHDDVQNVVANFNMPEEVMAELERRLCNRHGTKRRLLPSVLFSSN